MMLVSKIKGRIWVSFFLNWNHSTNTASPKAVKLLAQVDIMETMTQNMNN